MSDNNLNQQFQSMEIESDEATSTAMVALGGNNVPVAQGSAVAYPTNGGQPEDPVVGSGTLTNSIRPRSHPAVRVAAQGFRHFSMELIQFAADLALTERFAYGVAPPQGFLRIPSLRTQDLPEVSVRQDFLSSLAGTDWQQHYASEVVEAGRREAEQRLNSGRTKAKNPQKTVRTNLFSQVQTTRDNIREATQNIVHALDDYLNTMRTMSAELDRRWITFCVYDHYWREFVARRNHRTC